MYPRRTYTCIQKNTGARLGSVVKMRFHPESAFGKSWFEYYAANNLERLSYDERLQVYYNFSRQWVAK